MTSNGFCRIRVRRGTAGLATGLIALSILGLLAGVVASQRGNLAWDDADYLRRALADARRVGVGRVAHGRSPCP